MRTQSVLRALGAICLVVGGTAWMTTTREVSPRDQVKSIMALVMPCAAAMNRHSHADIGRIKAMNADSIQLGAACAPAWKGLPPMRVAHILQAGWTHARAAIRAAIAVENDDAVMAYTLQYPDSAAADPWAGMRMVVDVRTFWQQISAMTTSLQTALR